MPELQLPPRLKSLGQSLAMPWRRWFASRPVQAVTAISVGERCQIARVEAAQNGQRPQVSFADEGDATSLARWNAGRVFANSQPVLVLTGKDRSFLTLDRPQVPNGELALAVRFPLAEANDAEPDQLLTSAVPLLRINEAIKRQVLAVSGRLDVVKRNLELLAGAGVRVSHIDVSYSALRGMALIHPPDEFGWITVAMVGGELCIGLVWKGEFCALRTLALPVRSPREGFEFEGQLALHIQRTSDLFERQATELSVRHVLASLPALSDAGREQVRSDLPLSGELFEFEPHVDVAADARAQLSRHADLTALACVAFARLFDARPESIAAAKASASSEASG